MVGGQISPRRSIQSPRQNGASGQNGSNSPRRTIGNGAAPPMPPPSLNGMAPPPPEIQRRMGKKGKEEDENKMYIDSELTRSLPLYLSIYIFGESTNKTLRNYVSKYFNATHLDVIIFLTHVESYNVPISKKSKEYGP